MPVKRRQPKYQHHSYYGKKPRTPYKRSWEDKKRYSNIGDFALIRLLFGNQLGGKVIKVLRLTMMIGLPLGIFLMLLNTENAVNLGLISFSLGLFALFLLFILTIIGWIYNKFGNVIYSK